MVDDGGCLERNNWSPAWFGEHYPTPVVITPVSHIGW